MPSGRHYIIVISISLSCRACHRLGHDSSTPDLPEGPLRPNFRCDLISSSVALTSICLPLWLQTRFLAFCFDQTLTAFQSHPVAMQRAVIFALLAGSASALKANSTKVLSGSLTTEELCSVGSGTHPSGPRRRAARPELHKLRCFERGEQLQRQGLHLLDLNSDQCCRQSMSTRPILLRYRFP